MNPCGIMRIESPKLMKGTRSILFDLPNIINNTNEMIPQISPIKNIMFATSSDIGTFPDAPPIM